MRRCLARRPGDLARDEQAKPTEDYAGRALALLVRARTAGFFRDKAALTRLQGNGDFAPLRLRADLQKWLAEVEKAGEGEESR